MNPLKSLLNNLPSVTEIGEKLLRSLIVIAFLWSAGKILQIISEKILRSGKRKETRYLPLQRLMTVESLLKSVISYSAGIIGFMYLLTLWFGTAGITLAGVGGVAIGFGAQSIIKDVFAGIFILAEDKYKIGEFVTLGSSSGFVEEINLRTTVLRGYNGDLHMVPNGSVEVVTNVSRGIRRFMVELGVDAQEDMDKVIKIVGKVCAEFALNHKDISEPPFFSGITSTERGSALIRVQGKTTFLNQWNYENILRENLLEAFRKEEIRMTPKINYVNNGEKL